jgi:hypothetical protein
MGRDPSGLWNLSENAVVNSILNTLGGYAIAGAFVGVGQRAISAALSLAGKIKTIWLYGITSCPISSERALIQVRVRSSIVPNLWVSYRKRSDCSLILLGLGLELLNLFDREFSNLNDRL